MKEYRTVSVKGQVTIPESIRSELGIEAGDRVIFEYSGDNQVVVEKDKTPMKNTAGLLDKHLKKNSKGVSVEDMQKAIQQRATMGIKK